MLAGLPVEEEVTSQRCDVVSHESEIVKVKQGDAYLQDQLKELNRKIELLASSVHTAHGKNRKKLTPARLLHAVRNMVKRIRQTDRKKMNLTYTAAKHKVKDIVKLLKNAGQKGRFTVKPTHDATINDREIKALIGPPGVGKTMTIIKLAVQFSMRNDLSDIGVISINPDDLYIKNKLCHYCDLYDIDYRQINTRDELCDALDSMQHKRLVLIDTHGVSQRDAIAVSKLKNTLDKARQHIQIYLTMSASTQPEVIEDCIRYFKFKKMTGCILTKVDEAIRLEPVLDTLVRCKLGVSYITNGEDLDHDIYMLSESYDADVFDLEKLSRFNLKEINVNSINW